MASLKGSVGEFRVCREFLGVRGGGQGRGRHPYMGLYLPIKIVCASPLYCVVKYKRYGPLKRMDGNAVLLEL